MNEQARHVIGWSSEGCTLRAAVHAGTPTHLVRFYVAGHIVSRWRFLLDAIRRRDRRQIRAAFTRNRR